MKRVLVTVFVACIIVFLVTFTAQGRRLFENIVYYSPCDTAIRYSIGTIDSRFNVKPDEFLTDAKAAVNIWNATQSKQLFVYDPTATFTINMVYDSRQALTNEITKLNSDLKQKQGDIDPKIAAFKKKQDNFEARVNQLNQEVKYWNSRGGAPQDEYNKLVSRQKDLQVEARSLNEEAQSLGQSTQEYNLNAQKLNQTIDNYKQVLHYKPEEGLYEQEGNKRKISIYIDISKKEFLHTLTHEFGHALGLDHNDDEKSIMFPQTTTVLQPSKVDTASLDEICKKRTVFEVLYNKIHELNQVIRERMKSS